MEDNASHLGCKQHGVGVQDEMDLASTTKTKSFTVVINYMHDKRLHAVSA